MLRAFQVSRSAVREALSALKAMGLVEMKQGEGTYLKEFEAQSNFSAALSGPSDEKEDVKQLLEVRKLLEIGVASLAAEKRTEADLERIQDALKEMGSIEADGEPGRESRLRISSCACGRFSK